MGLSFLELMLLQYAGYLLNGIGILYTVHVLWQKKIHLTKYLLSFLIFYALVSIIVAIMSLPYMETGSDAKIEILFEAFKFSALVLYYMYLFRSNNVKKIFPSIMISSALEHIFSILILSEMIKYMKISSYAVLYLLHISLVCIAVILFMYLISKTKIIDYFRELLEVGFITIPITTLYLIIVFGMTYYIRESGIEIYKVIGASIYIVAFLALGLISRDFYNKKQLQQSETLLLQQQLYVNRLESIQQELRMIQHNYKNMVAGLYAQADEGNTDAIKEYINKKILNIDDEVQNDIRQTNQISRIANMELKGLLLVKILEAKNVGVQIELEVIYKVEKIPIDTKDLVCCIGILLDNAIEEAQNTITKNVSVVVLQEEHKITIVVKNDILDSIDISNIWENGYSTKGDNRGLGLSNYKKILSNYENIFCETKVDDKQFVQIIVIT